jgi:hypothetical protein
VSETTNAVAHASQKTAAKTADKVAAVLPDVVETVEVAMEVPAKVVLNQKVVVVAASVAGAAFGIAGYWGFNKWRNRNKVVVELPEDLDTKAEATA